MVPVMAYCQNALRRSLDVEAGELVRQVDYDLGTELLGCGLAFIAGDLVAGAELVFYVRATHIGQRFACPIDEETLAGCKWDHVQVLTVMAIDGGLPLVGRVGETKYGLDELRTFVVRKAELEWHIFDDDQSCQWFVGLTVRFWRVLEPMV